MLCPVALVRTDVSEERRFLLEPHGMRSQKTPFFLWPPDHKKALGAYLLKRRGLTKRPICKAAKSLSSNVQLDCQTEDTIVEALNILIVYRGNKLLW
jgi:hypothetical protein